MPVNRIVILLTPIFVGLAGYIAELASKYLPGAPALDKSQLTAVFITGAIAATTAVLKWLHGHQKAQVAAGLMK